MPSGMSLIAAQFGQLGVQAVQLLLRLNQLRILASRISLHALNLHFLGGDLCAQRAADSINARAWLSIWINPVFCSIAFRASSAFARFSFRLLRVAARKTACAGQPQ